MWAYKLALEYTLKSKAICEVFLIFSYYFYLMQTIYCRYLYVCMFLFKFKNASCGCENIPNS